MPPVLIAAGVTAAASIGGAVLSSSSQKKAANSAANSAASTAASNNALQKDIYNQNSALLSPYVTRGNEAGQAINSLLGIAGSTPTSQSNWGGYLQANPDVAAAYNGVDHTQFATPNDYAQWHYQHYGQGEGRQLPQNPLAGGGANGSAQGAFQNYLNSTGYQFQMDQGTNAINSGYAAGGTLQSGDAMKALQTYGQNTGKAYFNDYLGQLSNQQGVGLSGASAVAGVGQNYANNVSANNNAAGSAQQNALLAAGGATAGMYGNIAGAIGGVANAYASSYRPRVG